MKKVSLIVGDGIGPEVVGSVKAIFSAMQIPIVWEEVEAGASALEKTGKLIPQALIDSINTNKIALKGPLATPIATGFRSVNVSLRKMFDLYINLRPVKTIAGVPSRYENIDIILLRV